MADAAPAPPRRKNRRPSCPPRRHASPRRIPAALKSLLKSVPSHGRLSNVCSQQSRAWGSQGRSGKEGIPQSQCTPARPGAQQYKTYKFMVTLSLVLALFTSPFAHGWLTRQTVASHLLSYHALRSCQSIEPGPPRFSQAPEQYYIIKLYNSSLTWSISNSSHCPSPRRPAVARKRGIRASGNSGGRSRFERISFNIE